MYIKLLSCTFGIKNKLHPKCQSRNAGRLHDYVERKQFFCLFFFLQCKGFLVENGEEEPQGRGNGQRGAGIGHKLRNRLTSEYQSVTLRRLGSVVQCVWPKYSLSNRKYRAI